MDLKIQNVHKIIFVIMVILLISDFTYSQEEDINKKNNPLHYKEYISFQGRDMSYEEALPILEDALDSSDISICLFAVEQLAFYGDSLNGTKVVSSLIILYNKYPTPPDPQYNQLSDEEGLILGLKGEILATLGASSDFRGLELIKRATNDSNSAIRWWAKKIKSDFEKYNVKKGGIVVNKETGDIIQDPFTIDN
jgi:hypothetical protein